MADMSGPADFYTGEITGLRRRIGSLRTIEPAKIHSRIWRRPQQNDFAVGFEAIVQAQRPDPVGAIAVKARPPKCASDFPGSAAGMICLRAETVIVRSTLLAILKTDVVS